MITFAQTILAKIHFLRAFLKLIKDPASTENIFKMSAVILKNPDIESAKNFVANATKNKNFRDLYRSLYLPKAISQESLLAHPNGSLGHAYGRFLQQNKLQADFYPQIFPKSELDYLTLRMRQTHDIFHVLTGFESSLEDELALQSFLVAQLGSPFSALLITAGLLHTLKSSPQKLRHLFSSLSLGFNLGRQSTFLLGVPWEELWNQPLDELRRIYRIESSSRLPASSQHSFNALAVANLQ